VTTSLGRKVLFLGSVEFSERLFRDVLRHWTPDDSVEVLGFVSLSPMSQQGDYRNLKNLAQEVGLPYFELNSSRSGAELESLIGSLKPDLVISIGWPRLIPETCLNAVAQGVIGYHPTALPRHRGRHPLIWSIALGLKNSASSFFVMTPAADAGDLVNQATFDLEETETARTLYEKLLKIACQQLKDILDQWMVSGALSRKSQDPSLATSWRKRNSLDGQIDWRMSAFQIDRLVRALSDPYPGATLQHGNQNYKIWKTLIIHPNGGPAFEPGRILYWSKDHSGWVIACGDQTQICLITTDPPLPQFQPGDYL
jgi:methionyl-tRNA formyltransferase